MKCVNYKKYKTVDFVQVKDYNKVGVLLKFYVLKGEPKELQGKVKSGCFSANAKKSRDERLRMEEIYKIRIWLTRSVRNNVECN